MLEASYKVSGSITAIFLTFQYIYPPQDLESCYLQEQDELR